MKQKTLRLKAGSQGCRGFCYLFVLLFIVHCAVFSVAAFAQDDMSVLVRKQKEINEKEEAVRKEEERLNAIRKDVDGRIEKYTKLLEQLENILKKIEQDRNEKLDSLVKAYEAMPAEDAATKLSALDKNTALKIISKMKSKKVGAILALMDSKKAVSITEDMAKTVNIFPTK